MAELYTRAAIEEAFISFEKYRKQARKQEIQQELDILDGNVSAGVHLMADPSGDDWRAVKGWFFRVGMLKSLGSLPLAPTPVDDSKAPDAGAKPITLTYRNYRGEVSERTITPKRVWFGSTEWHPEPQWLLTAFDHDKGADRDFALADFGPAAPVRPEPPAELVALAEERFGSSVTEPTVRAIAAFAAEYAAEQTAEALTNRHDSYLDMRNDRDKADARAASAEKDRDALLSALGFKPGPITDARRVILRDAEGLRPAMVKARREAADAAAGALLWKMFIAKGHASGLLAAAWKQQIEWKKRAETAEQALAEECEAHNAAAARLARVDGILSRILWTNVGQPSEGQQTGQALLDLWECHFAGKLDDAAIRARKGWWR